MPKIALLPLFLIWFGLGEITKIVTVAVAVFFVVLITTVNGVRLVEPVLIEAAQSYGARGWRLFSKVILPATLPAIFTGLRLGLGTALLVIVGAEFVASNKGIGYLIRSRGQPWPSTKCMSGWWLLPCWGCSRPAGWNVCGAG